MIAVVGAFSHFYSNKFTALLHSKFMSFFYRNFFSSIVVVFRRRRRCNSTWFTRCCDNYFQYSHLFLCFVLFFVFFLIATNFFRNINALNEIKKKYHTIQHPTMSYKIVFLLLHFYHDRLPLVDVTLYTIPKNLYGK